MNTPEQSGQVPVQPRQPNRTLAIYALSLTAVVLGGLGWYIWQGLPAATCPQPQTIQYSYDDPRDYLGPFLSAVTSHDSLLVRRYYVPGISKEDRATLQQALDRYRSLPLAVDGWQGSGGELPWSDIGDRATTGASFTRLTWTTQKVDGCWRVRRVDTQTLTN